MRCAVVQQRREELAPDDVLGGAAGVRGDVDRGDHAAARVADRRRDRAQALLELLVDQRPALLADRARARRAASSALSIARAVSGRISARCEVGVERRRQRREQDAAHRGRVGREARADVDRDAHDARGGDAADVDDLVAVEHRHRAGLADLRREPLEVRLGDLGQAQARQVRVAELEHARGQREVLAVAAHVAEVDQREQEAARGRAREVRAAGDVGERQLRVVGAEGADDRQAALE